jgi:hypothetical protein
VLQRSVLPSKGKSDKKERTVLRWNLRATLKTMKGVSKKIDVKFTGDEADANTELDCLIAAVWVIKHRQKNRSRTRLLLSDQRAAMLLT